MSPLTYEPLFFLTYSTLPKRIPSPTTVVDTVQYKCRYEITVECRYNNNSRYNNIFERGFHYYNIFLVPFY